MKTVRELIAKDIDTTEVDVITIYYDKNIIKSQVDNLESLDDEYLDADDYEDDAAEDGCLACDLVAEGFSDVDATEAETKGDETDDENGYKRFKEGVICNGEAYGESVDRGCDTLKDNCLGGELCARAFLFSTLDAFVDHLTADESEQT